ncbi:hypothetical protein T07_2608 [Trichinella nelsoni]|uniref:Uncharacterized protein n=1 Tax=Trichinella nelsoni TaxID=6336 RepID=A0A0V0RB01_9BILA|nr:hypothetical protein T07_2608 [Trichinella nelsoni]
MENSRQERSELFLTVSQMPIILCKTILKALLKLFQINSNLFFPGTAALKVRLQQEEH